MSDPENADADTETESWTLLRQRGIRPRMRCSGQIASQIEQAFTTVEQLVEAIESEADLTDHDGIGPATAEVIEAWWADRFEREAQMDVASVERTSSTAATVHFHDSWRDALGEEADRDGGQELRTDGGARSGGAEHDGPAIEVSAHVYERFEAARTKTKTDHVPAMDRVTFLSSLLDTHQAVNDGYYERVAGTETDPGESFRTGGQHSTGADRVEWWEQASENVDEWGQQDVRTLLLAMQEELGELTQAYLVATFAAGDPDRIEAELADLGALCIQLQWRLNERAGGAAIDRADGGQR